MWKNALHFSSINVGMRFLNHCISTSLEETKRKTTVNIYNVKFIWQIGVQVYSFYLQFYIYVC